MAEAGSVTLNASVLGSLDCACLHIVTSALDDLITDFDDHFL